MTLDEALDQLTQLHDMHGDLPVLHEGYDEGPDEGCIVRLQPVLLREVAEAEDEDGTTCDRLFFELPHQGDAMMLSEMLAGLNALAEEQPGDLLLVLEADYGYLDELADIDVVDSLDQLGPFFEEDIVDINASQFPCVLIRAASTL
ncbi:hypothetical protein [Zymobacter sp. IVIA_12111.31 C1]|uniref:hypothetical protein n=1 Tax=Zymobacter sp. IVIA_12111.31 C1 TaxID=3394854 RepID=UPI0039C493BE